MDEFAAQSHHSVEAWIRTVSAECQKGWFDDTSHDQLIFFTRGEARVFVATLCDGGREGKGQSPGPGGSSQVVSSISPATNFLVGMISRGWLINVPG